MASVSINVDGASRGNPGAAGIGVVVYGENGDILREISEYIGKTTNNVAEYTALIRGLEEALDLGADSVFISTDSELMARQIAGIYKVKNEGLAVLFQKAKTLLSRFKVAKIRHIPREQNSLADSLASKAATKKVGSGKDNGWVNIS